MCGIAGLIAKNVNNVQPDTVDQMRKSILYRGRDDQQDWSDGQQVVFLHSRLSIIDLTTGSQPMKDMSGRYVIVYNGEIYNYKELRADYERQGACFTTQSDTEVILEGYKLKGDRICSDLNGMFAFAIWDKFSQRLFLARDHLGKKPLYWYVKDDVFYFSSTMDSFRAVPGWENKISFDAIRLYTRMSGFPNDVTVYDDAHAVPYATCGFVEPGQITPNFKRYWQMDFTKNPKLKLTDALDEYDELITHAIAIRLRSDVPLAITFSGGVDSGTIAAICSKKLNTSLVCYTIDYHTKDDPSEETLIAERTAKHLGLDWKYINFDYHNDLLKDLPQAYSFYDQPAIQLPLVYSYKLYSDIKPFATVVLSGNGSDEIFTGYIGDEATRRRDIAYMKYAWIDNLRKLEKVPYLWRLYAPLGIPNLLASIIHPIRTFPSIEADISLSNFEKKALHQITDEQKQAGVESFLDLLMFNTLLYGAVDSNFRLPDISGLAAQVEVRSPYLDYRLVEFAARLPGHLKVGDARSPHKNKYLPKVYYERYVPQDIAWARKKGMGMNLQWGRKIVSDPAYLAAFEAAYKALDQLGVDTLEYRNAWADYRNGDRLRAGPMMAGFMLQKWLERDATPVLV